MLPSQSGAQYEVLRESNAEEVTDCDETPQETGVMIHVVESNRARWNHIEDLDSFFTRMYCYHQKHGFTVMMVQEGLELLQFIFVVYFTTFLFHCVDYPILFKDAAVNTTSGHKVTISDAILERDKCVSGFGVWTWLCLVIAIVFWIPRAIKVLYHFFQFRDIKLFYNTALKIEDNELDNLTWHEIQMRVRQVQIEQQMCIHKRDLTELDIYHRILRFKNYMVAMVNKNLLPLKIKLPLVGEFVFFTRGLKYNLEMILFWGPWSPFENNWHLREEYKKASKRQELAATLSRNILWIGLANVLLCPVIMLWQILYAFFNYAEVIKREPGSLGARRWSMYGRLYLRHFNELDHELNARLNRAYRPASRYMNIFNSPLMSVVATNLGFICGGVLAVLLALTIYDEDVITVEHVLTLITVLGGVVACCRAFIPDENLVWCPEQLMTAVLAQAHYLPDHWRGCAHTVKVRKEFSQLFQFRAVFLLEELLSPLLTPLVLCFALRKKALEIVDFYRNFTVSVVGVGDVCSFAQMDVRKHGNPDWQTAVSELGDSQESKPEPPAVNQCAQAEDGKTELSLIHFTMTNPAWKMPTEAQNFVEALRRNAQQELCADPNLDGNGALSSTFQSINLGAGYSSLLTSFIQNTAAQARNDVDVSGGAGTSSSAAAGESLNRSFTMRGALSRAEGPAPYALYNLHHGSMGASVFGAAPMMSFDLQQQPQPQTSQQQQQQQQQTLQVPQVPHLEHLNMGLSTLYLHELHQRQVRRRGERSLWQRHTPTNVPQHHNLHLHQQQQQSQQHQVPAGVASGSSRLAESTPLLRPKDKR